MASWQHANPFQRPVDTRSMLIAQRGEGESSSHESDDDNSSLSSAESHAELYSAAECQATGNDRVKQGALEEALLWYARALAALVSEEVVDMQAVAAVLCNRSMTLLKLGRHSEALEDATQAVSLQPEKPKPLYRRACALRALGQLEDAVHACDAGLALAPGSSHLEELRCSCTRAYSSRQSNETGGTADILETERASSCDWKAELVESPFPNATPDFMPACNGRCQAEHEHFEQSTKHTNPEPITTQSHSFYRLRL
ncbi:hypothetical protein AB1Y20_020387 [Prymnesium parvum]|uniref:Peptidylprolyl isomerase n=1 Tax=Prymnesium parvum TaxID=97485 RepID=A0AB34JUH9_PRYPA